ncbi:MAG: DNA alkylation response protein [Gammaproteobacteria bacterium]|nr:MAG: DNA alkylation response protein [Gammaproteobacteria bacterium]
MSHYPQATANAANTHEVTNMPPLLEAYNLYDSDQTLQELVGSESSGAALSALGKVVGSPEHIQLGIEANRVKPVLETHNRYGHRIDKVTFHPAYHQLMALSCAQGLAAGSWAEQTEAAQLNRAARYYLINQGETGHGCPVTMTFACVPTLQKQPDIAAEWLPKVFNTAYDPRNVPHTEKSSVTIGMGMTEKQGGSDVRQNSTRAYPIAERGPGKAYELVGHKFFVSAPMCDAFLVLAQAEAGISCFLVPRWRPDGSKNPLQIIRLKDKMGNASNASSETELRGAFGWLIGEEGRGIANILEMVALTRFDCLLGSSAAMRAHMTQIIHHLSYRKAFGKTLDQQPLMQNVLADMELEAEAAAHLAFRVASALDNHQDEHEAGILRLATAVGKYWVCKRQVGHAYEAMECIGGSAVMENSVMPRLYRDAPINTIWEGSGNVQCLDVLRIMQRDPTALEAFLAEIQSAKGSDSRLDAHIHTLHQQLGKGDNREYRARTLTKNMALALQGALLIKNAPSTVADAFCAARLQNESGLTYGMLPEGIDCAALIDRGRVRLLR